jgi:hypothetical protein
MGKGDRRRKAKAQWRDAVERGPLPALQVRERRTAAPPDEPMKTALQARLRHAGVRDTPEAEMAAKSPLMGCDVGRCITSLFPARDEQMRLWAAFCGLCAVYERHATIVLGVTYWPPVPRLELMPEPAEADPDEAPDTRTQDERIDDAIDARRRWDSYLSGLPGAYISALAFARLDRSPTLWRMGAPTDYGRVTVRALAALADALEKK